MLRGGPPLHILILLRGGKYITMAGRHLADLSIMGGAVLALTSATMVEGLRFASICRRPSKTSKLIRLLKSHPLLHVFRCKVALCTEFSCC
ncbi:unnamed protein product [Urochloa humidicola]